MKNDIPIVIADEKIPFLDSLAGFPIQLMTYPSHHITRSLLIDIGAEALLIRTRTQCTRQLLEGTKIKFIATATSGLDHIDQHYCSNAGIEVVNAPGCNSGAVYQYITACLFEFENLKKINLSGLVLGVIGRGQVGEKIVNLGNVLGMEVLINDPPLFEKGILKSQHSLDDIITNADIVSLHVPYTNAGLHPTHHLINSQNIGRFKPTACLINTSRGGVVDELALYRFASIHKDFSYILDVWENEPKIELHLLEGALFATPHIAGYSLDGKRNASQQIFNRLAEFYHWDEHPVLPSISVPPNARLKVEHLIEAVRASYNILKDDEALRKNPSSFEHLRSSYKFRHEFHHFEINIQNEKDKRTALDLGFREWTH